MRYEIIVRGTGFRELQGNNDLFGLILSYLTAKDLSNLSVVCKHLLSDTSLPQLWKVLIDKDFIEADVQNGEYSKSTYVSLLTSLSERVIRARSEKSQIEDDKYRQNRIFFLQIFLDVTQLRIMAILPPFSLFLTVLMLSLKFDGNDIAGWICFVPIIFLIFYVILSIGVASLIYRHQFLPDSMLRGLWSQMCGPIRMFYTDFMSQSSSGTCVSILVLCLCIMQTCLLSAKLTGPSNGESNLSIPWGIVFLPIWCLFLLYCLYPVFGGIREVHDAGPFAASLIFAWVPLFIFFVCLTTKLNGNDARTADGEIRLALIFMPFWIYEGIIMVSVSVFLLHGVYRFYSGFLDRLDEHIGLFVMIWGVFTPFVIFQALLCSRDDGNAKYISVSASTSPLLILLLGLTFALMYYSVNYRTPYEVTIDFHT